MDDVWVNNFKAGYMAALAGRVSEHAKVTYAGYAEGAECGYKVKNYFSIFQEK